ncbi:MAG: hypothetical protein KF685_11365 [Acidobacteria bacterium]|nr:hypothetical protein [Acidobacteriota bacterium]
MLISDKTQTECPACGTALRDGEVICSVCQKRAGDDYQPLDMVRSSYHLHGVMAAGTRSDELAELFPPDNKNTAAQIAWASFVFSLVPFLGILFVPVTLFSSAAGYVAQIRRPAIGGGASAAFSFCLSFAVTGFQVLLWWLLYIVPELAPVV